MIFTNWITRICRKIHPVIESDKTAAFLEIGVNVGQQTDFVTNWYQGVGANNRTKHGFRVNLRPMSIESGISFGMRWGWDAQEPQIRYHTFTLHIFILHKVHVLV